MELIHLTVKLTLQRSLSIENHQDLVLEALEDAKKELG
jgi:hypothetical protein